MGGMVPRRVDTRDIPCQEGPQHFTTSRSYSALGCLLLGCCLTTSVFLTLTTLHYRQKIRKLKMLQSSSSLESSADLDTPKPRRYREQSSSGGSRKKSPPVAPAPIGSGSGRDRERQHVVSSYPVPCHSNAKSYFHDFTDQNQQLWS